MLNFKDAEQQLNTMVEENPNNPEICQLLHDITFNYLYNILKPGSTLYDYEMISWDLASDLFLRIRKGCKITYYVNYISHLLKINYLRSYERDNWSVIIDVGKDDKLEEAIQLCCIGNRNDDVLQIENILTGLYFEHFEGIITDIMKETKFKFCTSLRLNLELSVLLTLIRKKVICYRLDRSYTPYIHLIISKIKSKMAIDGICGREQHNNLIVFNNLAKLNTLQCLESLD